MVVCYLFHLNQNYYCLYVCVCVVCVYVVCGVWGVCGVCVCVVCVCVCVCVCVPNASEYKVLQFTTQFIYTRASEMENLNIFIS